MVEVKYGEVYTADFVRSGESGNGKWLLTRVKDSGKSRKEITLWVSNADCGLAEGMNFKVKKIESIKLSARKDNSGVWHDTCACNVEIELMGGGGQSTIYDLPDADDGELPF